MEEFRGVKGRMPREYVFEMLPPLRPRMFSIASDVEVRVSLLALVPQRPPLRACTFLGEVLVLIMGLV